MKELLLISVLTFFVLSNAKPRSLAEQQVESEKSVKAEELTRVRRQDFDYQDFMSNFWKSMSRCKDCNILSIGNGYKNTNTVYFNKRPGSRKNDPFNSSFWND